MAWTSTVPAAIDALVQAFAVAPGLEGVQVQDGPAVASQAAIRVLSVGWAGLFGEAVVDAQSSPDSLAGSRSAEEYTIRCTAAVLMGSTGVQPARNTVYAIFNAAGAEIVRDQTLGHTVTRAYVGAHSLVPEQTDKGVQMNLVFEVNVEAFTRR